MRWYSDLHQLRLFTCFLYHTYVVLWLTGRLPRKRSSTQDFLDYKAVTSRAGRIITAKRLIRVSHNCRVESEPFVIWSPLLLALTSELSHLFGEEWQPVKTPGNHEIPPEEIELFQLPSLPQQRANKFLSGVWSVCPAYACMFSWCQAMDLFDGKQRAATKHKDPFLQQADLLNRCAEVGSFNCTLFCGSTVTLWGLEGPVFSYNYLRSWWENFQWYSFPSENSLVEIKMLCGIVLILASSTVKFCNFFEKNGVFNYDFLISFQFHFVLTFTFNII